MRPTISRHSLALATLLLGASATAFGASHSTEGSSPRIGRLSPAADRVVADLEAAVAVRIVPLGFQRALTETSPEPPHSPTATTTAIWPPATAGAASQAARSVRSGLRPSPLWTAAPMVAPTPARTPAGSVAAIIVAAARAHGVDPGWMLRIARCESGLNPRAVNPRGPYEGLFQFLPSTFRGNGGTDIWDPFQQADVTAAMLAHGQAHQWSCA